MIETIEECMEWLQAGLHEDAISNIELRDATIAYLHNYARLKAMLDDPRVVRVPKDDWMRAISWNTPIQKKFGESASEQVAAWDKEREQ